MLLIADSGGTKTDWLWGDEHKTEWIKTVGMNPNLLPWEKIQQRIEQDAVFFQDKKIDRLYFFGAGLSLPSNQQIFKKILEKNFPHAEIQVHSDLLGACYAGLGSLPGVLAILGTGSVACYYDGKKIEHKKGGLGFLLGDEGSGIWLGKMLIHHYLENIMPENIAHAYSLYLKMDKETLLRHIYQPLRIDFLAQQTYFLQENIQEKWIQDFLHSQFQFFFETTLKPCMKTPQDNVVVTGGIAQLFFHFLAALAKNITLLPQPFVAKIFSHCC